MTNLHEIIELRAAPDTTFSYRCTIDRRRGADFDVVFDYDSSSLRNLQPALLLVLCVAKAVATDNGVIVNYDSFPDDCAFTNRNAGMYNRASSDRDVVVDRDVRINANVVADERVSTDHHTRADRHTFGNTRCWIDHGGRMNKRLEFRFGIEDSQRPRVCEIRILHTQDRYLTIGLCFFTEVDGGRASSIHARRVARVSEKRHVPFACLIQPRRPRNVKILGRAFNPRPRPLRQL